EIAPRIVLIDAFVANVDRTPRNPNLLFWHARAWLIDHGASLYFHHGWGPADRLEGSRDPFAEVRHHVLLPWATELERAARHLTSVLDEATIARAVEQVPASWLAGDDGFADAEAHRAAYASWLSARVSALPAILQEAQRA